MNNRKTTPIYSYLTKGIAIVSLCIGAGIGLTPLISGFLLRPYIEDLYTSPIGSRLDFYYRKNDPLYQKLSENHALQEKFKQLSHIFYTFTNKGGIKMPTVKTLNSSISQGWFYTTAYREQQWEMLFPETNQAMIRTLTAAGFTVSKTQTGYTLSVGEYGVFQHTTLWPVWKTPSAKQQISLSLNSAPKKDQAIRLKPNSQEASPTKNQHKNENVTRYLGFGFVAPDCASVAKQAYQDSLNRAGAISGIKRKHIFLTIAIDSSFSRDITSHVRIIKLPALSDSLTKTIINITKQKESVDYLLRLYKYSTETLQQASYTITQDYQGKLISSEFVLDAPDIDNLPLFINKDDPKILKQMRLNIKDRKINSTLHYHKRGYDWKHHDSMHQTYAFPKLYDQQLHIKASTDTTQTLHDGKSHAAIKMHTTISRTPETKGTTSVSESSSAQKLAPSEKTLMTKENKAFIAILDSLSQFLPVNIKYDLGISTNHKDTYNLIAFLLELGMDAIIHYDEVDSHVAEKQYTYNNPIAHTTTKNPLHEIESKLRKKVLSFPIALQNKLQLSSKGDELSIYLHAQQHQHKLLSRAKQQGSSQHQATEQIKDRSLNLEMMLNQNLITAMDRIAAEHVPSGIEKPSQKFFDMLEKYRFITKNGSTYKFDVRLTPDDFVLGGTTYPYYAVLTNSNLASKIGLLVQEMKTAFSPQQEEPVQEPQREAEIELP